MTHGHELIGRVVRSNTSSMHSGFSVAEQVIHAAALPATRFRGFDSARGRRGRGRGVAGGGIAEVDQAGVIPGRGTQAVNSPALRLRCAETMLSGEFYEPTRR